MSHSVWINIVDKVSRHTCISYQFIHLAISVDFQPALYSQLGSSIDMARILSNAVQHLDIPNIGLAEFVLQEADGKYADKIALVSSCF